MSKMYFIFSLVGASFAISLDCSDFDLHRLQQKTLVCLHQGSETEAQGLIDEIQAVQDVIHQNYQFLDAQLQAVGCNYAQCHAFVQRFMALDSEALVQDETAPYNNNFLFESEKQILFRGLKAKRIAQQHHQNQDDVEQRVKSALDAYVQQNLMLVGSEQLRLFQANQSLLLQKFSLGNKSITLNSWKDSLGLHKNRCASVDLQPQTVAAELTSHQYNVPVVTQQEILNITQPAALSEDTAEDTNDTQIQNNISAQVVHSVHFIENNTKELLLVSNKKDDQESIAIKMSSKTVEKEKKQKAKEAEHKKIQVQLQQQAAKRQADEAEKQRRELQRQKDLEKQAQQKAAENIINNKNNKVETPQEKQKQQALAKKQAQVVAAQQALQAKLKAEDEENRLLEQALQQTEKDKDKRFEDGRKYALSLAKKNGWRIKGDPDTGKAIVKIDVGLSEQHIKVLQAYFNFINFPSIDTLNDELLDKIITAMPVMIGTMRNVATDVSIEKKDLAEELLKIDPDYFKNIAQVRLNWVSALQFFAHQYTNDVHTYDTLSHTMRRIIKDIAPEQVTSRMRSLKERQHQLTLLDQQIKKIYCVIGLIDSLQDEGKMLAKFTPDDINQRVLFMQNHIEKVLSMTELPLSLKNEIDEIYPKLRELNAQAVSLSFSEKNIQDQQSILNLIVDVAYDFFEKNEFRAYGDYTKYKSTHKSELENSARTAYKDYVRSEEDILLFMTYQDKMVDQLLSLALNRNHELFLAECLKLKK